MSRRTVAVTRIRSCEMRVLLATVLVAGLAAAPSTATADTSASASLSLSRAKRALKHHLVESEDGYRRSRLWWCGHTDLAKRGPVECTVAYVDGSGAIGCASGRAWTSSGKTRSRLYSIERRECYFD